MSLAPPVNRHASPVSSVALRPPVAFYGCRRVVASEERIEMARPAYYDGATLYHNIADDGKPSSSLASC